MDIYELISKAQQSGLLQESGHHRNFLDAFMTEYKWMQVFTRKEYEELKSFQKDMNDALDGIDKAREERYNSGSVTREDIVRLLDRNIKAQADHWGTDYIYTRWARAHKVKALDTYDRNLEPVDVAKLDWHYENGCDFEKWLYTDGSIRTCIYGAS